MSFDPLPGVLLQWDESTESASVWLRYEVWSRVTGTPTWVKRARITSQAVTSWTDYAAVDGVQYDYAITQVIMTAGVEVSSAFPTPVQAQLGILSLWLHDVQNPAYYVEAKAVARAPRTIQDVQLVQPRLSSDPVAHIGYLFTQSMTFDIVGVWNYGESAWDTDAWDALVMLEQRQRDDGSILLMRTGAGMSSYCVLTGKTLGMSMPYDLSRADSPDQFKATISIQQVAYDTAVA